MKHLHRPLPMIVALVLAPLLALMVIALPSTAGASTGRTPTANSTSVSSGVAAAQARPALPAGSTGSPTITPTGQPPVIFTPLNYPGIDHTIPLTHKWLCNEPAGSTVCHDSVGTMNLTIMANYAPNCTFNGSYVSRPTTACCITTTPTPVAGPSLTLGWMTSSLA